MRSPVGQFKKEMQGHTSRVYMMLYDPLSCNKLWQIVSMHKKMDNMIWLHQFFGEWKLWKEILSLVLCTSKNNQFHIN